jgi:hypothetical protein
MKVSKLAIGYLLVQGVELAQSKKFVDTTDIIQEAEILQESLKQSYTIPSTKFTPLNKEKTRFKVEGVPNGIFMSSATFNSLDFTKTYDLLIKSLDCKEILAYVQVES